MEVFENNVLRKIMGPVYNATENQWERRHNVDLREMSDQPFIQDVIRSRRLRWAGHCARMSRERIVKKVMNGQVEGNRPVCRPRYRWIDNVRKDVEVLVPQVQNWQALAQDRGQWKGVVMAAMGLQTRELI